jgi:hypothetical protein
MKISIHIVDEAVYLDGVVTWGIDMSGVPAQYRALQFETNTEKGEIEFVQKENEITPPNEVIVQLPTWAESCVNAAKAKQGLN